MQFGHDYMATPKFVNMSTEAYIHHTSGTTSGLPKPIPQVHAAATYHLPFLPTAKPVSTLTMTPLYHGGVADLMRSLMSRSMIWLYPHTVPVTTQNIIRTINTANTKIPIAPVRLFTAVPYILKMCLENSECLRALRDMEMVAFGGAQMPDLIGNSLVGNGVNLVSRYGSTECGCESPTQHCRCRC